MRFSSGWAVSAPSLHQLRHSAATHFGELQRIMAKSRHRNPRSAMRYIKPGAEARRRGDRAARPRREPWLTPISARAP